MRFSDLENVRVAILGTAREGQAVWRQLRHRFPDKVLSLYSESDIDKAFSAELDPAIDVCHSGPLDVVSLGHHDVLVRSAGISPYRHELQQLRTLGLRFTSACNLWFAENPDANTICISGTMGKSTTASLTAHLLEAAGLKICLCGNIGRPMLDCENLDVDWWVIELSSYQISDLAAQPDIAVLLNLSEEHLDWHHGLEHYRADKLKLAQLAVNGRIIANFSDSVLTEGLKSFDNVTWFNHPGFNHAGFNHPGFPHDGFSQGGIWLADEDSVCRLPGQTGQQGQGGSSISQSHISAPASLRGAHNMQNLAAALSIVEALGLDIPQIDEVLLSFTGLPHRLQFIGEKAGIRYINDSISTTPVSVTAALQTIGNENVVLLLGGMDRGLDWSGFAESLHGDSPYAIITMPDNGPVLFDCLRGAAVEPKGGLHTVSGLKEALVLAQMLVPENGCILLSPGAPSFPHFRDFEDRGNQFRKFAGF